MWCVMASLSHELGTTGSVVPVTRGAAEAGHGAEVPGSEAYEHHLLAAERGARDLRGVRVRRH